jgi:hypothetical protein
MPLTPEQEAQLAALQAEAVRPEPRTETGIAGILHTLIDVASGAVAHLGSDVWAGLHHQAEALAPQPAEPEPGPEEEAAPPAPEAAG